LSEKPIELFASRAQRYPEPTQSDVALGATRAALAAIPVVGGSVTELMSFVITPSVARRRDQWLKDLADGLDQLEAKVEGFQIADLQGNESFVSAVIEASKTAIGTHKKEKHEALRNALLNIALRRSPEEDQQQIFLRYIEELTAWHIKFLALFQDPPRLLAAKEIKTNYYIGAGSQVLEDVYPELSDKRELYDQIATDLDARGLIGGTAFLHGSMSAQGMVSKRTTPLADAFLAFVSEPPELSTSGN
jgi:hypothetical protein